MLSKEGKTDDEYPGIRGDPNERTAGSQRADGIVFNGVRSSMMRNVSVQGVTRAKAYAFPVQNVGIIADASANFFFGLRSITTWGGLYMTGSDPTPTIDNFFFGLRLQAMERGIFLDRGTQSTSTVSANGFWGVMIDTSSDTAVGVDDGGARNHFERLVAENTTAHGLPYFDRDG